MQADGYCINSESCELSLQKKTSKKRFKEKNNFVLSTDLYYQKLFTS